MAVQFRANWISCLMPTHTFLPKNNFSLQPIKVSSVYTKPNTSSFRNAVRSPSELKLNRRSGNVKLCGTSAAAETVVAEEAPVDENTPETASDTEVRIITGILDLLTWFLFGY